MLEKNYGTLLFDVDGTLLEYGEAQRYAVAAALAVMAVEVSDELMERVLHLVEGDDVQDIEACRPGWRPASSPEMQAVFDAAGVGLPPGGFLDAYFRAMSEHGVPLPGIEDMLQELGPGRSIGVVTNGLGPVQRSRLAISGLMGYFDALVISCEVGVAKPDPEMLRLAMKLTDSSPEETLFVGDSVTSDMGAAEAAGVDFAYLDPSGGFQATGPRVLELRSAAGLTDQLRPMEVDRRDESS